MIVKTPYNDPTIWTDEVNMYVIPILDLFLKSTEQQANTVKTDFHRNRKFHIVSKESEGNNIEDPFYSPTIIETYEGLDGETFSLTNLFENHFPNLIRSSAFISLYSSMEIEIQRLCDILKVKEQYQIRYTDLKNQGLVRTFDYLNKMTGIKININDQVWKKFLVIKNIRNLIVHNEGILTDASTEKVEQIKLIPGIHLEFEQKIIIEKEFLEFVISCFKEIVEEISQNLRLRYGRPLQ